MRPLTEKMKLMLVETFEREQQRLAPRSIYYTQSAKGLVVRGLFCARMYNDNRLAYMGFYLTDFGQEYVKKVLVSA